MSGFQLPPQPGGYGPFPPNPPSKDPYTALRASNKIYRPDAGSGMTDSEYYQWQQGEQRKQRDIQFGEEQRRANLQNQGQASTIQQQAAIAAQNQEREFLQRSKEQEAGFGNERVRAVEGLKAQEAGFAGQSRLQAQAAEEALKSQAAGFAGEKDVLGYRADLQRQAQERLRMWIEGQMGGLNSPTLSNANTQIEDAADANAFARAKDRAALIGRSALTGLQEIGGARGLTGSGLAVGPEANVINQAATQVGEVSREQAIQRAAIERQRAAERLQAALTTRGQNIGLIQAAMAGLGAAY